MLVKYKVKKSPKSEWNCRTESKIEHFEEAISELLIYFTVGKVRENLTSTICGILKECMSFDKLVLCDAVCIFHDATKLV